MTTLTSLYDEGGQSPWLDNIRRDWLRDGTMATLVDEGIRGVTSNPTIFAKALEATDLLRRAGGHARRHQVRRGLRRARRTTTSPTPPPSCVRVYESSDGTDGFVSFEVAPTLAHDTDGHDRGGADGRRRNFSLANLLVKVPATVEGLAVRSRRCSPRASA